MRAEAPPTHLLPGLRAVFLPPRQVAVCDSTGANRFFAKTRYGMRTGANMRGEAVFTVCVRIDGTDYVVPPSFIQETPPPAAAPSATVLPFPRRVP